MTRTETVWRRICADFDRAKRCTHSTTRLERVDESETDKGTLLDSDVVRVCTAKYCGKVLEGGLDDSLLFTC